MNLKDQINHFAEDAFRVLFNPKSYWDDVRKGEGIPREKVRRNFQIGLLAVFIAVLLGKIIFDSTYGVLWADSFVLAIRQVVFVGLVYYTSLFWIYEIARLLKLNPEFKMARAVAVFSMVPVVVAIIVTNLLPFLEFMGILSLYSFVLIFFGVKSLFAVPKEKIVVLFSILFLTLLFNAWIVSSILNRIVAFIVY